MATQIKLGNIAVDVVLKDIKNVHLSVYPPTGRVRISAPKRMSIDNIRAFAISKLGWIKLQQQKLQRQERETPREYLDRDGCVTTGPDIAAALRHAEEALGGHIEAMLGDGEPIPDPTPPEAVCSPPRTT